MLNNSEKAIIIIQARIGSSRLPGKVLSDICGKPLLWHIINRLNSAQRISDVVLAIPDTMDNDILKEFAIKHNLKYSRGSEDDVLSRFYNAAIQFNAQVIIRWTADNPVVDPKLIDNIVEAHLISHADYTYTSNYPLGMNIEVFNFESLEKAYKEAKLSYEREHVTPYIYKHPELFKVNVVHATGKLRRPDLRLTVDTEEDMTLIREIFKRLYREGQIFYIEDVIDLLDKHPELLAINTQIKQKAIPQA